MIGEDMIFTIRQTFEKVVDFEANSFEEAKVKAQELDQEMQDQEPDWVFTDVFSESGEEVDSW